MVVALPNPPLAQSCNDTVADLLGLRAAFDLLDQAEAGLADVNELADADWTLPARLETALLRFNLAVGPRTPLAILSGRQRSRAALAALILSEPDILLLDAPTNHLDRNGINALEAALRAYDGAVLVISHDRPFLKSLGLDNGPDQCRQTAKLVDARRPPLFPVVSPKKCTWVLMRSRLLVETGLIINLVYLIRYSFHLFV